MGGSQSTEYVTVTVTVYTSTTTWTFANGTFTQPSTYGVALTTPWTRPCKPTLYFVPSPDPNSGIDKATLVPTPTVWEVPPQVWFQGNVSCLPPSYLNLMGLNTATPTLQPYSPAICPEGFTTAAAGWNNKKREVEALCCESGYFYMSQGRDAVYGCQSTISNTSVVATYLAVMTSPVFSLVEETVILTTGVIQGLSIPVAWRTQDTKLFPETASPTLDPNWHIPKVLTRNEWIGVGVGTGVGAIILLCGLYFCCRSWWAKQMEERERRQKLKIAEKRRPYPRVQAFEPGSS